MNDINFKDWFEQQLDELNAGLKRQFKQQNPHIPDYVAKDLFHQRLGGMWRNSTPYLNSKTTDSTSQQRQNTVSSGLDDTIATPKSNVGDYDSIKSIMQSDKIKEITDASWEQKPRIINVTPNDFEINTKFRFEFFKYGNKSVNQQDAERHQRASQNVSQQSKKQEPVVILKLENGILQLVEGYHRTMAYLFNGCPPEFKQEVMDGNFKNAYNNWQPVKLRAYIGVPTGRKAFSPS